MLSKDQLIFDPTAVSNADCDTVGAHLLDGAGNKITSTDLGGGVQAVDVNVAGGTISVDLDFATDQVDASGSVVALDAATLAALESVTVSAVDLDIRDLAFATDSVDVTGSEVSLDAATLAALETITVTATDLDIRDLSATTDNVAISDGTDTLAVNADGSINVQFAAVSKQNVVETNDDCAHSAVSITTTATPLVTTALTDRTTIHIQNLGSKEIYIGCDNSVTSTNGTKVPKGGSAEFKFSDAVALHAITASGTADVRIIELACT